MVNGNNARPFNDAGDEIQRESHPQSTRLSLPTLIYPAVHTPTSSHTLSYDTGTIFFARNASCRIEGTLCWQDRHDMDGEDGIGFCFDPNSSPVLGIYYFKVVADPLANATTKYISKLSFSSNHTKSIMFTIKITIFAIYNSHVFLLQKRTWSTSYFMKN